MYIAMRTGKTATSTTVGDKTAMHSPQQRFKEALRRAPTHTLSFTVAKLPQATADQHARELVSSPFHYSYASLRGAIPYVALCASSRMRSLYGMDN